MTFQGWASILGFVAVLVALTRPMGRWLFALYEGRRTPLHALLSSVGHDLRTPLTAVIAAAEQLDRDAAPEVVAMIRSEAARLARLVADLLDMTRVEAGALTVRLEATDLGEAVAALLITAIRIELAFLTGRRGVEVAVSVSENVEDLLRDLLRDLGSPCYRPQDILPASLELVVDSQSASIADSNASG